MSQYIKKRISDLESEILDLSRKQIQLYRRNSENHYELVSPELQEQLRFKRQRLNYLRNQLENTNESS